MLRESIRPARRECSYSALKAPSDRCDRSAWGGPGR
jgi:hypothetical protein